MDININDMIISTVVIAIPELVLMDLMVIILLKEDHFLKRSNLRENLSKLIMFVIIPETIFTTALYYLDPQMYMKMFINICMKTFLMFNMLGYFGRTDSDWEVFKDIGRVFGACFISSMFLFSLEILIIHIPEYVFDFGVLLSRTNRLPNYAYVLPIQVIMLLIVYYNYVRINTTSISMLDVIWKGKMFKKIILAQIVINIFLVVIIYDKFIRNRFLHGLGREQGTFIAFLIITIMVIGNLIPWFIVLTLKLKQRNLLEEELA